MIRSVCHFRFRVTVLRTAATALALSALLSMMTGAAGRAQLAAKAEPAKAMVNDADPDWEVATVRPSDPNDENQTIRMRGRHLVIQKQTKSSNHPGILVNQQQVRGSEGYRTLEFTNTSAGPDKDDVGIRGPPAG